MNRVGEIILKTLNKLGDLNEFERIVYFSPIQNKVSFKETNGIYFPSFQRVKVDSKFHGKNYLEIDQSFIQEIVSQNSNPFNNMYVDSKLKFFPNEFSWEILIPYLIFKEYTGKIVPVLIGNTDVESSNRNCVKYSKFYK